ncbi:MAG: hypothetical protein GX928_03260 [Ruminococcaceae bacterium]|nr:hypothetical protein [Oscillospiraceae bacterium]
MKRISAILLVAAMILALSSCGLFRRDKQAVPDASEEIEKEETGSDAESVGKEEIGPDEEQPSKSKSDSIYTISNKIIVDNEYVTLAVTEAYTEKNGDFKLKMLCKNKTDDPISAYCENASINGYMIYADWYSEARVNSSDESEMVFYAADLKKAGITLVEDVELFIFAYSYGDEGEKSCIFDYYSIYPTGLHAGSVTYPDKTRPKQGVLVVNTGDFKFCIERINEKGELGYTLQVYIENNLPGTDIYVIWEDESVNGFKMDSYWGQVVLAGKRAVCDAPFLHNDFDKNGIKKVDEIEFKLKAVNFDDWDDVIYEGAFIYNP